MATYLQLPFVDSIVPEYFIFGMHDVQLLPHGMCRFVPYTEIVVAGEKVREPPFKWIMPRAAIVPCMSSVLAKVGPHINISAEWIAGLHSGAH